MPFGRCRSPFHMLPRSRSHSHSRSRSRSKHTRYFEEIYESSSSDSEVCMRGCDCNHCFPVIIPVGMPQRRSLSFERDGHLLQQNVNHEIVNIFAGIPPFRGGGGPRCVVIDSDDSESNDSDDDDETKLDFPRIHGSEWDRGRSRHVKKLSDYRVIENEDGKREVYNVNQFFKNRLATDEAAKQKQKEASAAKGRKCTEDIDHVRKMYARVGFEDAEPCRGGHRTEEAIRQDIAKCDAKLEQLHQGAAAQARRKADRHHWEAVNDQDVFCHGALLGGKKPKGAKVLFAGFKKKVEPNIQCFSQHEDDFKGRHIRVRRQWK